MVKPALGNKFMFFALMVVLLTVSWGRATAGEDLSATVERYFSSNGKYRDGDLLTQSHLEEVQGYLRRTQGSSPATHPKLHKRMLPDQSPLAKLFFSGGRTVLSQTASATGGYSGLDRLSRNRDGRQLIQNAIKKKNADELVKFLTENPQKTVTSDPQLEEKQSKLELTARIYTAADYLAAFAKPEKAKRTIHNDIVPADAQQKGGISPDDVTKLEK